MDESGREGYAVKKDGKWYIGSQYLGPGRTSAVWDEKPEYRWTTKDPEKAKRMAGRTGGKAVRIRLDEKN